ncbi:multicopper oxidase [Phaeosphaeriaceae sp. SRC1lsM3a]|nr:multicopper oxidase [Stagonospora sp. SRC1lsM3a]
MVSYKFSCVALATALLASPVFGFPSPEGDFATDSYGGGGHVNGNIVKKDLFVTYEKGAPDGQERQVIYVNGQFPAPPLIFDEDDNVEITVYNKMEVNTTVHWHGLEMIGTPWSDGVPGLTQKPIDPGEKFVYRFKASPPGTYWYHSHTRTTLLDGLYGPLFIKRKQGAKKPWDQISKDKNEQQNIDKAGDNPTFMTVSDWSKVDSETYIKAEAESNFDIFCRDSVLINGKGSVYCPGKEFLYKFVPQGLLDTLDGQNVNDKGCLPFVPSTEGPWFDKGNVSAIPAGMQEGCVASKGQKEIIEVNAHKNGGWLSLNFVMAATFMAATVSIDEHDMWLFEVDGHYVTPQKYQGVTMNPGERYSVMIKLDKEPKDYNIRVASFLSQTTSAFGVLRYKGGKKSIVTPGVIPNTTGFTDYGGFPTKKEYKILDGSYTALAPFPPNAPPKPKEGDEMHVFHMGRWGSPWKWTMSGNAIMPPDANAYDPLLYNPTSPLGVDQNLTIHTKNGSWVDLVLCVGCLPGEPQEINHAIHKHASKVWLIGSGQGIWNYSSVPEAIAKEPHSFNLETPNYRDTIMTTFEGSAWFVLRYQVTNPGAWLLHCHVEIHLAGGMGIVIMDGADKWPTIPPEYGSNKSGY